MNKLDELRKKIDAVAFIRPEDIKAGMKLKYYCWDKENEEWVTYDSDWTEITIQKVDGDIVFSTKRGQFLVEVALREYFGTYALIPV